MSTAEYSRKLDELDRLLNDPDVPIQFPPRCGQHPRFRRWPVRMTQAPHCEIAEEHDLPASCLMIVIRMSGVG
jgi:hypothetical protein